MTTNNYTKFLNTYSGKRLLEKHSIHETGIWEVRGEDPNCEWAGPHHEPYIGTYTGVLADVIILAVESASFWTWGGGRRIDKVNIEKIDNSTVAFRNEKRKRLKELEQEVNNLKYELSIK